MTKPRPRSRDAGFIGRCRSLDGLIVAAGSTKNAPARSAAREALPFMELVGKPELERLFSAARQGSNAARRELLRRLDAAGDGADLAALMLAALGQRDALAARLSGRGGAAAAAAWWLARSGDRRVLPRFLKQIRSRDPWKRQIAAYALGHVGGPSISAALSSALSDPDALVRKAAAMALDQSGRAACVPALCRALGDGDAAVVHYAAAALSRLADVRAASSLAAFLKRAASRPWSCYPGTARNAASALTRALARGASRVPLPALTELARLPRSLQVRETDMRGEDRSIEVVDCRGWIARARRELRRRGAGRQPLGAVERSLKLATLRIRRELGR